MMSSPKTPAVGKRLANLGPNAAASNQQAVPLPYFGGRRWLPFVWACSQVYHPIVKPVRAGGKGKAAQSSSAREYYGSVVGLLACCRLDYIEAIEVGGTLVWTGWIERDEAHPHYAEITVAYVGVFRIYWGTGDQPADDLVLAGCGEEHPRYLDQAYAVVKDLYFGQGSTTPPTVRVLAERAPAFDGLDGGRTREGANPVTVFAEVLGDGFFGLGRPDLVHVASWSAVAAEQQRERVVKVPGDDAHVALMGYLSPFIERTQTAQSFFGGILENFDGWFRSNAGQIELGYFPHDGVLPEDLLELSYHDFTAAPQFTANGLAEIVTDVTVTHADRELGMEDNFSPAVNVGARRRLGAVQKRSFKRPFVITTYQGREQAGELAKFYGRPEETAETGIRREKLGELREGDRFVLNDYPGQARIVVRITRRTDPAAGGSVKLSLVAERALAPLPYIAPALPQPVLEVPAPVAIAHGRILQLPPEFGAPDPAPTLVVLAERPAANVSTFSVYYSAAGDTYDLLARLSRWALRAVLSADATNAAATLTIAAAGYDLAVLASQSDAAQTDDTLLLVVGFEILSVGAVTALGGGSFTVSVLRGRRGSSAAAHANGDEVYLIARANLVELQHADFPRSEEDRYFKLPTATAQAQQELADALAITFAFDAAGVVVPTGLAAVAKAEAIFISLDPITDRTIAMVELFERDSADDEPAPDDVPEFEFLATGFNRGGLAAGATKYYWARFRDTIADRSAFVGPVNATALAAPQGEPGAPGEKGDKGDKGDPGDPGADGAPPSFTLTLNVSGAPFNTTTGAGTYPVGTLVAIHADADVSGHAFSQWSAAWPDIDFVQTPGSNDTFVLMTKNITLSADY